MKLKTLLSGTAFALLSLSLIRGQESFSFKLYMESLANGKKDTLELGIAPDGYIGCDYENVDADVVFDPFLDQQTHIGAFVTPDRQWNEERFQYIPNCMVFYKKGINTDQGSSEYGPLYDVCILVPSNSLPAVLRWDKTQIPCHTLLEDKKLMDGWMKSDVPKTHYGITVLMHKTDSFVLYPLPDSSSGNFSYKMPDSIFYQTFITDSAGNDHGFRNLYIDFHTSAANENIITSQRVQIIPNPVSESFYWQSDTPIKEWEIRNTCGQLILNGANQQNQIHCQGWPNGLYFFTWEDIHGNHGVQKIIKMQ